MKYKVYHAAPDKDFENNGINVAYFSCLSDARDFRDIKELWGRKTLVVLLVEQEVKF